MSIGSQTQEDFFAKVLARLRATKTDLRRTGILAELNEYDARAFIKYILRNYRLLPKTYKKG